MDRLAADTGPAEVRDTFEVNVFGVVAVVHATLPLLRAAAAPRIVNVSSTTASPEPTGGGTDFGGDLRQRPSAATPIAGWRTCRRRPR